MVDPTGSPWRRPDDACCSRTAGRWSAGGAIYRVRMDAHEARTAEAQQRAVAEDELARSALRQAEIERRIAEAQQKLKDRELARKGKRGRMTVHEQAIENKLNALLVRLRRGYLPGEVMSTPSAPPAEVFASAQQNLMLQAERRRPAGLRPRRAAVPTVPMTTEAAPAMRTTARRTRRSEIITALRPSSAPSTSSARISSKGRALISAPLSSGRPTCSRRAATASSLASARATCTRLTFISACPSRRE